MRADIAENFNQDTEKYKDYKPRNESIKMFKTEVSESVMASEYMDTIG